MAYVVNNAVYCAYDPYTDAYDDCFSSGPTTFGGLGAFLLFDCVWTLLALIPLAILSRFMNLHPIIITVLDGLVMLLWFCGAIGFAVLTGGLGFSISDAMIALAFVIWALFVATFVLNLLSLLRGNRSAANHNASYNHNMQQQQQQPAAYNTQNPELAHV